MKAIELGAPSLEDGKDACSMVREHFSIDDFPLKAKFTNLVAHSLNFPEIPGLHMKSVAHESESSVVVVIQSLAAMIRLASSIDQVAFAHNHPFLVSVVKFVEELIDDEQEESEEQEKTEEPVKVKKPKLSLSGAANKGSE